MFGHDSVEKYYNLASLHDKLDRIQVPCLCLSASDDPFCLESGKNIITLLSLFLKVILSYLFILDIPLESADDIENLAILVTARGGHIGFLEGVWPFSNHNEFMFRLIDQYFSSIFKNHNYKKFIK